MDVEPVLIGPIWKTNRGGMACAQAKVTRLDAITQSCGNFRQLPDDHGHQELIDGVNRLDSVVRLPGVHPCSRRLAGQTESS